MEQYYEEPPEITIQYDSIKDKMKWIDIKTVELKASLDAKEARLTELLTLNKLAIDSGIAVKYTSTQLLAIDGELMNILTEIDAENNIKQELIKELDSVEREVNNLGWHKQPCRIGPVEFRYEWRKIENR